MLCYVIDEETRSLNELLFFFFFFSSQTIRGGFRIGMQICITETGLLTTDLPASLQNRHSGTMFAGRRKYLPQPVQRIPSMGSDVGIDFMLILLDRMIGQRAIGVWEGHPKLILFKWPVFSRLKQMFCLFPPMGNLSLQAFKLAFTEAGFI